MKHFEHSPLLRFVNAGIVCILGRCVTMMAVTLGLFLTACNKDQTEDQIPSLGESFYWDGTGTADDPYLISSVSELKYLEEQTAAGNYFSGEYFEMTNDINLENEDVQISRFDGTFDGKGYSIRNLNIQDYDQTSYSSVAGLFKYLCGGTVCNLNVEGIVDLDWQRTGCVVGGVVGFVEGTVKNCTFKGSIMGSGITNFAYVGGVAGLLVSDSMVMGCAYLEGLVDGSNATFVGGVIGFIETAGYVIGCYNAGTVTTNINNNGAVGVGGVVGGAFTDSSSVHMVACYNKGIVTSRNYAGSLAGYCEGITVTACYDTETSNGAFVGYANNYTNFHSCYWLNDSNYNYSFGASNLTDCVAKSEEELKSQATVDALNTAIMTWNSLNSDLCTYRFAVNANGEYPVLVAE